MKMLCHIRYKTMNTSTKHQFALYYKQLPHTVSIITISDPALVLRIGKVLRLQRGDIFILFDGKQVVDVIIENIDKKQCIVNVQNAWQVTPLKPEIHCIVPLLKREALEEVMYAAVELGANTIQLVATEKIHRAWAGQKEFERLQAIMIAACEQSKQFAIPALHSPIEFNVMSQKLSGNVVFFDAHGESAYDVITQLRKEKLSQVTMLMGPEADLTDQEKDILRKKGVMFCKLTPTVLRARQAFAVGLGMLRSMLSFSP